MERLTLDEAIKHAKEVAKKIARQANVPLVLGSATPQIESYARGKKGYYELVSLTKRANNANYASFEYQISIIAL